MSRQITLTWPEVQQAAIVGVLRQSSNLEGKLEHKYNADPDRGWDYHITGALGELAVAKSFGIFWSGSIDNFLAADVGHLQVRATPGDRNRLTLHPKDGDGQRWILVTGRPPQYTIHGWVFGHEGKRQEYWEDPTRKNRPCYFVPQHVLRDIETVLIP